MFTCTHVMAELRVVMILRWDDIKPDHLQSHSFQTPSINLWYMYLCIGIYSCLFFKSEWIIILDTWTYFYSWKPFRNGASSVVLKSFIILTSCNCSHITCMADYWLIHVVFNSLICFKITLFLVILLEQPCMCKRSTPQKVW